MEWNGTFPVTERLHARFIAQAIVRNRFNMEAAVRELMPNLCERASQTILAGGETRGQKILAEPLVRYEIGVIMDRTENDAKKFLKLMWSWLENEGVEQEIANGQKVRMLSKTEHEQKLTAARILAKGYIQEKGGEKEKAATKPMVIEGLGDGIKNLTGEAIVKADPKKVM